MSQTRELIFEWTLLGLLLILGGLLFVQALPFLNGTLGAITLYILLRRTNLYLTNRFSERVGPWVLTLAVMVFVMIPLTAILWYIIDLIQNLNFDVNVISKRITATIAYVERTTHLDLVSEKSMAFVTAKISGLMNMMMSGINNMAINLFTAILLLFFLLAGGVRMELAIARCLPFNDANKHAVIKKVSTIVKSNAIGIPLLAMIQGAVAAIGYSFCGVENPIEFGVLTGFASMIPIVGSMLVWIPLTIVQYFEQGMMPAIYVAAYGIIIISQCDNVLRMFMQKRMANTHPLITIFGVIAGLPLFGFMGLIFGPLLVAMFLLFLQMFVKQYILGDDTIFEDPKDIKHENKNTKSNSANAKVFSKEVSSARNGSARLNERNGRSALNNRDSKDKAQADNDTRNSAKAALLRAQAKQDNSKFLKQGSNFTKANGSSSAHDDLANNKSSSKSMLKDKDSSKASLKDKSDAKSKSGSDFKNAKAESKQQKREAATLRALEEQKADDRNSSKASSHSNYSSASASSSASSSFKREPINLAERSALKNALSGNGLDDKETMGQNLVARAVSDAIGSFDKFDDLDHSIGMSAASDKLFKDDYLAPQTREHLANERSSKVNTESNDEFAIKHVLKSEPQADLSANAQNAKRDPKRQSSKKSALATAVEESANLATGPIINPWDKAPSTKVSDDILASVTANNEAEPFGSNEAKNSRRGSSDKSTGRASRRERNAKTGRAEDSFESASVDKQERKSSSDERRSDRPARQHRKDESKSAKNSSSKSERNDLKSKGKSDAKSSKRTSKDGSRSSNSSRGSYNSRSKDSARASANGRGNSRSNSSARSKRSDERRSERRSRSSSSGYQTLRSPRKRDEDSAPLFTTVVSHQFGQMESTRKPQLRTQLVSMHTAKGTMVAASPRRRPSKRRPYH